MATNIGPVIGIEGEREFRNQIRQINASLQALKSEEDAVTSAYDKNDQSAEKLTRQNDVLNKRIEEQRKLLQKLQEGLQKASAETGENSTVTLKWQSAVNRATTDLNKMERQLQDNQAILDQVEDGADKAGQALDSMGDGANKSSSSIDALADVLMAEKLLSGLERMAELLWSCVEASASFESAMAGVAKTTDLNDDELEAMGNQLKALSTQMPIAANELAGIVEAAGQLGIAKEDLVDFSTVMANLGVSTNLSANEAATALARFANITGTSSDDYERLGSTVVALGNNFATTESEIVEMSTRLASAGSVVGLTEAEIMAAATALSSVGIEAEAGGSAIAKLLKQFETMVATGSPALADFADVAGMTAEQFSAAWEDNALEALSAFIDGLGDLDKSGGNATATMSELGLTEVRLSNAVLALAQSDGILTKALKTSNAAWEENTALAKEAETRYATTESKFQMLENSANNLKIAIGDALTPALSNLAEAGTDILDGAAKFIADNPALVQAISALAIALGVIAGAFTVATVAAKVFDAALKTLSAHPVLAIVTAVVALTSALAAFVIAMDDASDLGRLTDEIEEHKKSLEELKDTYEETTESLEAEKAGTVALIAELRSLNSVENKSEAQKARIKAIVDDLNQTVPDLALSYNEEKEAVIGLRDGIDEYIDSLYRQYQVEAAGEQIVALMQERADAQLKQAEAQENYNTILAGTKTLEAELAELTASGIVSAENAVRVRELKTALEQGAIAQAQWNDVLTEANGVVAGYDAQIDSLKTGMEELTTVENGVPESINGVISSIQALQAEYNAAYDAAYESLSGQTGLFKSFNNEAVTSITDLQGNLDSQIEWMTTYAENLELLAGRGIDGVDALVQMLSDGSAESAAALAGLATASDEEIVALLDSMARMEESKGILSGVIAEEATDFNAKMDEISQIAEDSIGDIGGMGPEAKQASINVVNGLIAGVDMRSSALRLKMITLGRSMISWINYGTNSHSPSKEAIKASENVMQGLILGVQENEAELDRLMEEVGERIISSFSSEATQEKAKEVMEAYQSYIEDYAAAAQDALSQVESAWADMEKQQEEMAQRLADFGELMETRTIEWSDGSTTTYTVLADLDAQISKIEQYGKALEALEDRGISQSLMQEVTSMDVEDAIAYANQLLAMTDTRWEEYNQAWEEKQRLAKEIAEKFYADELEALSTEYDQQLAESLDGLKDTAFTSGVETVAGLIKGLESKEAELKRQAAEMAEIVSQAMRQTLDIHSPSGVTEKLGEYTAEGFEIGLTKRMDELDRMTRSAVPFQQERDAAVVNAIGTLAGSTPSAQPAEIRLTLPNGVEIARWLIDDIRSLNNSDPEIKNDF